MIESIYTNVSIMESFFKNFMFFNTRYVQNQNIKKKTKEL